MDASNVYGSVSIGFTRHTNDMSGLFNLMSIVQSTSICPVVFEIFKKMVLIFMEFLLKISKNTKSMLLATATPVQMYPIEFWDLLYILSQKNDSVIGDKFSK